MYALQLTCESEELDSRYQIPNVDSKPVLRHSKYPDTPLTVVTWNQFTSPLWWMDNINFTREGNRIVSFEVNEWPGASPEVSTGEMTFGDDFFCSLPRKIRPHH